MFTGFSAPDDASDYVLSLSLLLMLFWRCCSIGSDKLAWYRVQSGWVVAYSDFGQRMIRHHALGRPHLARIVKMNFIETQETSWLRTTSVRQSK